MALKRKDEAAAKTDEVAAASRENADSETSEAADGADPDDPDADTDAADADGTDPDDTAADGADPDDTDDAKGRTAPPGAREHQRHRGRSAPLWIVAVYLGGLVLVFLSERVLSSFGSTSTVTSVLGVIGVVVGTTLRFSPRFRVGGQRQQIESWLGGLSVTGLVAVLLYFATTDWFAEKLGLFTLGDVAFDRVMGLLTVSWISLIVVGVVPMVFAETAAYPMRHAVRPESRRVRFATLSGVSLALALVYSALFVYAARGVEWSADYSYFKTSEPSESTRKIVKTLDEPVLVRAFFPDVNEVKDEVERYLKRLAKDAPKLQIEVKDRLAEPKLSRDLRITQDGTIVLTRGETHEQLRVGSEMEQARSKLRELDGDFQERLLKLVRSRRTVYLTVGHGEINDTRGKARLKSRDATVVKELLRRQNFTVKDLGLAQGLGREIPDDADLVLVLGPAEPLAPEEIGALKRYAEKGGKLFVALDPDAETATEALLPSELTGREQSGDKQADKDGATADTAPSQPDAGADANPDAGADKKQEPTTTEGESESPPDKADAADETEAPAASAAPDPNAELAAALGLRFEGSVLANDQFHMRLRFNLSDRTRIGSNRFSSHAAVTTLSRNASRGVGVVFDGAGSLEKLPGTKAKIDFAVRSMQGTYRDLNRNYRFDAAKEQRSNFNLAAAVTMPAAGAKKSPKKEAKPAKGKDQKPDQKAKPPEMRAFVVTDAAAFTDLPMSRFLGNQVLFVDSVRWLAGEESIMGEISSEKDLRIEHTKQEDLVWFYSTIFGAPALVLGVGLWLGRRPTRRARKGAKK